MLKSFQKLKRIVLLSLVSLLALGTAAACTDTDVSSSTGGSSVSSSSSSSQQPEAGGEITISVEKSADITVMAGEKLSLPQATATDEKGNDYTDLITIRCSTATILSDTFVAYTAMDHIVYYYLYDSAENLVCENIVVKVLANTQETTMPEGGNDLNNLKTEGKVFYENFEKGNNSPLIESSLSQKMYVGATADSISGNSLMMEWKDTSGDYAKRISDVTDHISKVYGQYTLGFDLKLVSGVGDPTWYFGVYNIELATDELRSFTNKNVDLSKLHIGDTIHLEKDFLLEANGTYYLEFFTLTASTEMTIAIDNVTLVYNGVEQDVPTAEEVEAGYVWDWCDNQMKVGEGGITQTPDKITATGFSERVLKLTTGGYHDFTATEGIFKAGQQYKISFPYCIETSNDVFYFMVKNSALSEDKNIQDSKKVYWDLTPWKLGNIEYIFTATENHTLFSVLVGYAGGTIYIGDVKVEPVEVKEYAPPSQEELRDGYTFKYTEELPISYQDWINYPNQGPYVYTENFVDKPVDITSETFSDTALRINCYGYTRLDFTKGLFEAGGLYEVSFEFSVYNTIQANNSICFWLINSKNNTTNGDGVFPKSSWNGTRYQTQKFTGTFKAVEGDDTFNIYISPGSRNGYIVIFLSEITIKRLYPNAVTPTQEELYEGYTYQMSDLPEISTQQWLLNSKGDYKLNYAFVDTPDVLRDEAGFGNKVLKINEVGYCANFDFLQGVLKKDKRYKISFKLYVVNTRADNLIVGHTDTTHILKQDWRGSGKETTTETYTYSLDFTALQDDFLYIYMGVGGTNGVEMYLGDVTVKEVKEMYVPTEAELKEGYTFEVSDVLEVTKPKYGTSAVEYVAADATMKQNGLSDNVIFVQGAGTVTGGAGLKFLERVLQSGHTYTIAFRMQLQTATNKEAYYSNGDGTSTVICVPNGVTYLDVNVTFTPGTLTVPHFGANEQFSLYIGDITVTDETVYMPTEEELKSGYTFEMTKSLNITTQQYVSAGSGDYKKISDLVDRPDFITDTTKFGDKVLKITEVGYCAKFDFMQGLLQEGKKYRVAFDLYAVKTRADNVIVGHTSTDAANILKQDWNGSGNENTAKTFSYSVEFTALANDFVYIYMGSEGSNGVEMYLGNVTVTQVD